MFSFQYEINMFTSKLITVNKPFNEKYIKKNKKYYEKKIKVIIDLDLKLMINIISIMFIRFLDVWIEQMQVNIMQYIIFVTM